MKAYKVLHVYKGRLFSFNTALSNIKRYINKKRMYTTFPWRCLEYKLNTWNVAKRNSKEKDLFVFSNKKRAIDIIRAFDGSYCYNYQLWEVEVDSLNFSMDNFISKCPAGTRLCKSVKLIKQIPV